MGATVSNPQGTENIHAGRRAESYSVNGEKLQMILHIAHLKACSVIGIARKKSVPIASVQFCSFGMFPNYFIFLFKIFSDCFSCQLKAVSNFLKIPASNSILKIPGDIGRG